MWVARRPGPLVCAALLCGACVGRPVRPLNEVADSERPGHVWRQMASGTDAILYRVWGTGPDNVFAAGNRGTLLRYDGQRWQPVQLPAVAGEVKVRGTAADDVWAPSTSTLFHYDGARWRVVEHGQRGVHSIGSAWPLGRDEVFFTVAKGRVMRFDGHRFTMQPTPARHLDQIWGPRPDRLFAVGVGPSTNVVRHDGSAWHAMQTPTGGHLENVWGRDASDVYAVGGEGADEVRGVIVHFDGKSWQRQQANVTHAPGDPFEMTKLMVVWGTGTGVVYAAGFADAILRHDGAGWRTALAGWKQAFGVPPTAAIHAMWGSGPGDIFAVGSRGLILHYGPADGRDGG